MRFVPFYPLSVPVKSVEVLSILNVGGLSVSGIPTQLDKHTGSMRAGPVEGV